MNKFTNVFTFVLFISYFLSVAVSAQETVDSDSANQAADVNTATTSEKENSAGGKKIIRDATISLQTTVTGNQEQPRVMYILPWQSPLSPDLDIEMLDSQQEAVFGHVEREELQRGLEAAGEFDQED